MTRWADILDDAGGPARQPRIFEGRIAQDATELNEFLYATIPAFDDEQEWGPAPWEPRFRILPNGALDVILPEKNDRCVVALAESPDPGEPEIWILQYWPYG